MNSACFWSVFCFYIVAQGLPCIKKHITPVVIHICQIVTYMYLNSKTVTLKCYLRPTSRYEKSCLSRRWSCIEQYQCLLWSISLQFPGGIMVQLCSEEDVYSMLHQRSSGYSYDPVGPFWMSATWYIWVLVAVLVPESCSSNMWLHVGTWVHEKSISSNWVLLQISLHMCLQSAHGPMLWGRSAELLDVCH